MRALKICIAPLDWGLGHTTRSIVLAQSLLAMGHTVYVASEGAHRVVLQEALPQCTHLAIKGYRITYATKRIGMLFRLLIQIPKIVLAIYREHRWLQQQQAIFQFDIIISDNRYGMYCKEMKSIFITHQLTIQTPWEWSTRLFQKIQYRWLQHFDECWIPDIQNNQCNLSGVLAHPIIPPSIPVFYMGTLSRLFSTQRKYTINPFSVLAIVSGPEPQRTLFEKIIFEQLIRLQLNGVIVAGRPKDPFDVQALKQIGEKSICLSHVDGATLASLIDAADIIICRGGYTTLMELIPFKKKLILVPTPGQTEQEYVAKLWEKNNWAIVLDQENNFSIHDALVRLKNTSLTSPPFEDLNQELIKARLELVAL